MTISEMLPELLRLHQQGDGYLELAVLDDASDSGRSRIAGVLEEESGMLILELEYID